QQKFPYNPLFANQGKTELGKNMLRIHFEQPSAEKSVEDSAPLIEGTSEITTYLDEMNCDLRAMGMPNDNYPKFTLYSLNDGYALTLERGAEITIIAHIPFANPHAQHTAENPQIDT